MATRFGNFKDLSQGKEPITDEEALALVRALGAMIPGGSSIYTLAEGKGPREALMELQDWIPGNAAYQNWLNGREQDWGRNAIDLATVGIPLARPAGKALKKGAEFMERIPKGGKEGFARNPIEYNKLAPKDQALVDKAIEDWNAKSAKLGNKRPQKQPQFQEFTDENLNENMWDLINEFQFYPLVNGKLESGLKTRAIKPENTTDAVVLRHYLSNYDPVVNAMKQDLEKRMAREGTLPRYEKQFYDDYGHFEKLFPTVGGGKTGLGANVKSQVLESLEGKFPGYLDAFEGRGPRQPVSKGNNLYYHEYSYPGTPDEVIELARNGKLPWSEAQKAAKEINEQISFAERALESDVMSSSTKQYMEELLKDAQQRKYEFDKEDLRRSLNDLPGEL